MTAVEFGGSRGGQLGKGRKPIETVSAPVSGASTNLRKLSPIQRRVLEGRMLLEAAGPNPLTTEERTAKKLRQLSDMALNLGDPEERDRQYREALKILGKL